MAEIKYLVIDPEKRTIEIPAGEELLGTESDSKVVRKYFQCPKIVGDNIDLSIKKICINYRNGLGEDGIYECGDVETSGSNITFSWQLERDVLVKEGKVSFNVCAKEKNSGNDVEWNTTLAAGTVLTGLEASPAIGKVYTNDANAVAGNMEEGYSGYVKGEKVEGTLKNNPGWLYSGAVTTPEYTTQSSEFGAYAKISIPGEISLDTSDKKGIIEGYQKITLGTRASMFGNAAANHVLKGKTFTSVNGVKIEGTLEQSAGGWKSGTLNGDDTLDPFTIDTGMKDIEKFVLMCKDNITKSGVTYMECQKQTDGTYAFTAKYASYSQYFTSIYTQSKDDTLTVNGGKVTWTPNGTSNYKAISSSEYFWLAVGTE